jgi:predicted ABC-type ATPase
VLKGGHDIPNEVVKRRFPESFRTFNEVIPLIDELTIYDNSFRKYRMVFEMIEGHISVNQLELESYLLKNVSRLGDLILNDKKFF